MLYVKFNKDYAQTGNKKDEIIRLKGKIPPHLREYVKEVKEEDYKKYQRSLDEEETDEYKRSQALLKNQKKAIDDANDPAKNTGDPVASATDPLPDGSNVVGNTQSLELNQQQNRNFNPPEISKPTGDSNEAFESKRREHERRTEADERSKKGSKK